MFFRLNAELSDLSPPHLCPLESFCAVYDVSERRVNYPFGTAADSTCTCMQYVNTAIRFEKRCNTMLNGFSNDRCNPNMNNNGSEMR